MPYSELPPKPVNSQSGPPPLHQPVPQGVLRAMSYFSQNQQPQGPIVELPTRPTFRKTHRGEGQSRQSLINRQRTWERTRKLSSHQRKVQMGYPNQIDSTNSLSQNLSNGVFSPEVSHYFYSNLLQEQGLGDFAQEIQQHNKADLAKIADLKEGIFEEMGLGNVRSHLAQAELVNTARGMVKNLNLLIARYDVDESQLKTSLDKLISGVVENGVNANEMTSLGLVIATGIIALQNLRNVNLNSLQWKKAVVVLNLLLIACSPINSSLQPTVATETLPPPRVGITHDAPETPTPLLPSTPQEENSFGLNGDNHEWPGEGVNQVDLVRRLIETGQTVTPSRAMTPQERQNLEKTEADISGLEQALKQRLTGNNILEPVVAETAGWAIEVKTVDGRLIWSWIIDENGIGRWADHPNQIPANVKIEFKKINLKLEPGEHEELFVYEGTASGIVVDSNGDISGVFNPLTGELDRIVTPTPTPTLFPTATATATAKPTEAQISTPTPNPDSISQSLGLRQDRQYTLYPNGKYIIDTYNQAKVAQWDEVSKTWQKVTDWDVMYEYMLRFPPADKFINSQRYSTQELDTPYNALYYDVQPIYTGNHFTIEKQVSFQPDPVTVTVLEGLVKFNGKTELIYIEFGSEDLPGLFPIQEESPEDFKTLKSEFISFQEAFSRLKPGQQLRISVIYQRTNPAAPPNECSEITGWCSADYLLALEFFNDRSSSLIDWMLGGEKPQNIEDIILPKERIGIIRAGQ